MHYAPIKDAAITLSRVKGAVADTGTNTLIDNLVISESVAVDES